MTLPNLSVVFKSPNLRFDLERGEHRANGPVQWVARWVIAVTGMPQPMYEEFFALKRRPFAVTPDPGCWHHQPPFQSALDELVVCAEQAQGIGILVAPAGAGKTLICERLIRELRDHFVTILLRHATFSTRRALLQSVLCEFKRPFDKLSDQELRLDLTTALKDLHQSGKSLVLVVDEAHQLSEAVLDELRILADHALDGRPLVRLILSGQLQLEEQLALPGAQALNQRIRAHVALPTLTRSESVDYIDYRITWAGGRTGELFNSEALDLICEASDGLPRCLNQLCDHALLLAYVNEERPVSAEMITDALADLRHLPLPWREVRPKDSEPPLFSSPAIEFEHLNNTTSYGEIESPLEETGSEYEFVADKQQIADDYGAPRREISKPVVGQSAEEFCEELVMDRYTALDAGLDLPLDPPTHATAPVVPAADTLSAWWSDAGLSQRLTERLAAVQHVLEAVTDADDEPLSDLSVHSVYGEERYEEELGSSCTPTFGDDPEEDVVAAVLGLADETRNWIEERGTGQGTAGRTFEVPTSQSTALEFGADISTEATERTESTSRSCRNLFTLLRRKQQGRL